MEVQNEHTFDAIEPSQFCINSGLLELINDDLRIRNSSGLYIHQQGQRRDRAEHQGTYSDISGYTRNMAKLSTFGRECRGGIDGLRMEVRYVHRIGGQNTHCSSEFLVWGI